MSERLLITGGAGFVGSSLALGLKARHPDWTITAFDNLRRRGSELILGRLKAGGIRFVHGDVRQPEDLDAAGPPTVLVDCCAEPSVLAGYTSSPAYVLSTNLLGTVHCLEHARRSQAAVIFLSTSRVYPMHRIRSLPYVEGATRLEPHFAEITLPGISEEGISEEFPLDGPRSLYGATKLASELVIQEYVDAYGMRAWINRSGVLAGPWQMGKVDQGIVTHWVASHVLGWPLKYLGYGGSGKQVRDVLHIDDLTDLIDVQLGRLSDARGEVYNVGGGRGLSLSLLELTDLCHRSTALHPAIGSDPAQRAADIPWFCTDSRKARARFAWQPTRTLETIVQDVTLWVVEHRRELEHVL